MSDEIKEILQLIGDCCYYGKINVDECEKYCNYITNLQLENERLIEQLVLYTNKHLDYFTETIDKAMGKEYWNFPKRSDK